MKLRYLLPWRRRVEDRDLDEELKSIVDLAAEEAAADGTAPDEARYSARRALGNLALAKENARAVWGWGWLESLLADLRYAIRVLRRDRAFTAVAVISLGLGIGVNAAIFSLIDAVLLRMLPVKEPERLVRFGRGSLSYLAYERFAAKSGGVLSDVIATATASARDLDAGGGPLRGRVELVSGNFFPALGVQAVLGRVLAPEDDRRGGPAPVAVLSYRYWRRQYGGEHSVLGRTIRIQKAPFTIVGVAPPEFFGVTLGESADVWAPLTTYPGVFAGPNALESPNWNFLMLLGRLQPGISPERASQVLRPCATRCARRTRRYASRASKRPTSC